MKRLKFDLSECGYMPEISMLRNFTNVIAGTGATFAAMHVFFGYMGFDKTPNEATGEVPSFLDVAEYRYYIVLFLLFALVPIVSGLLRRLPALALLPACVTATYVLLLYDADVLTAGPMTFLLFSLFTVAGHTYVALCSKKRLAADLYRYVTAFVGATASLWALKVYICAPDASVRLLSILKPDEALDGLSAVWRYERLRVLAEVFEAGNHVYYLVAALSGILLSVLLAALPRLKPLIAALAVLFAGYLFYLFGWQKLSYYPMLFVFPLLLLAVGCIIYCVTPLSPSVERAGDGASEEDSGSEATSGAEEKPGEEDTPGTEGDLEIEEDTRE